MSRKEVQKLLDNPPPSWQGLFKKYGLPEHPTPDQVIGTILEYTPTGRKYGEKGSSRYKPPASVRKAAMKGLKLSHEFNYTSSSGIGLARAIQLAVCPVIWERSVIRMRNYFTRHKIDKLGRNFGNDKDPSNGYMAWLNWGGDPGEKWVSDLKSNPSAKGARDSKGRFVPEKYLAGYKGADRQKRIKEIGQRRTEYQRALDRYGDEDDFPQSVIDKLYRPFKTDKGRKSRKSSYTVTAKDRGFTGSLPEKARKASKYYGGKIPVDILREVRKRGMAAWASGGHRRGQTPHSWGVARVNSFLVGGKTFFTADSDLAEKLPSKVYDAIEKQSTFKRNPDLGGYKALIKGPIALDTPAGPIVVQPNPKRRKNPLRLDSVAMVKTALFQGPISGSNEKEVEKPLERSRGTTLRKRLALRSDPRILTESIPDTFPMFSSIYTNREYGNLLPWEPLT